MRRATLALALLLAFAVAPPAASQHGGEHGADAGEAAGGAPHAATIGFDSVRPRRLDIVTGESVRWTNASARVHTVTADDESFDSGRLSSTQTYSRRFTVAAETPYHCSLHPLIQGVVATHDLLLLTPAQAAAPKRPFALAGRSALAAGTAVSIEADAGTGFAPIASATVDGGGGFAARITPETSVSLRAVAGGAVSPIVSLLVLDRRVSLTARRTQHGRVRLHVKVTPASRGGRVVLQTFLPERFGWWPVRQAKLDRASSATFTVHPTRRVRTRARYTLADGATALATSPTVWIGPPLRRAVARGAHRDVVRRRPRSLDAPGVSGAPAPPPPSARRVARGATTRATAPSQ